MSKCASRRELGRTVLVIWGVVALSAALAQAAPSVRVQRGLATVVVAEDQFKLDTTSPARSLAGGEKIGTGEKSLAAIEVHRDCLLCLEEKTSVVVRQISSPQDKTPGVVRLDLEAGSVRWQCCRPERKELEAGKEKQKLPVVDFEVKVGDMIARGRNFSGHIARLPEDAYEASVTCGLLTLQQGKLLAVLQAGQSVTVEDSFKVSAGKENVGYVPLAYVGAVVMLVAPGQSVLVKATIDGKAVYVTNLHANKWLYATGWDGIIMDQLVPGERKLYGVIEPVVPYLRALAHLSTLSGRLIEYIAGKEAPPEIRPPVHPRTDRVSASC